MYKYFLLATMLLAGPAAALQDPIPISAAEFLDKGQGYVGRRVLITDCLISRASAEKAYCTDTKRLGLIWLDGPTMDQSSLKGAIEFCASPTPRQICSAVVAGYVFPSPDRPRIRSALILWQAAERAQKWGVAMGDPGSTGATASGSRRTHRRL